MYAPMRPMLCAVMGACLTRRLACCLLPMEKIRCNHACLCERTAADEPQADQTRRHQLQGKPNAQAKTPMRTSKKQRIVCLYPCSMIPTSPLPDLHTASPPHSCGPSSTPVRTPSLRYSSTGLCPPSTGVVVVPPAPPSAPPISDFPIQLTFPYRMSLLIPHPSSSPSPYRSHPHTIEPAERESRHAPKGGAPAWGEWHRARGTAQRAGLISTTLRHHWIS